MSFLFSFSSPGTSFEYLNERVDAVANAYNTTQHNYDSSDAMIKRVVKSDDSNAVGKHHSMDTEKWVEIDCHVIDDNRIGVGRDYGLMDATVLIQIRKDGRIDKCKNYTLFHKKDWIEYRRERGEKKHKEPMIADNGVIWIGNTKEVYGFRVFVPTVKKDE